MTGRLVILILAVALLALPASAAAPDFAAMQVAPYDPPKPAPTFALPDLQGKMVRLADFKGQVVLAFFWATW